MICVCIRARLVFSLPQEPESQRIPGGPFYLAPHGKGWHDEKKRTGLRSVRCKDLFDAETLLEAIDASAGIHQLLLAGEERMALGADINLQLLLRAAGFKRLTAHAANDGLAVLGMDSFFYDFSPLSRMQ